MLQFETLRSDRPSQVCARRREYVQTREREVASAIIETVQEGVHHTQQAHSDTLEMNLYLLQMECVWL